MKAPYLKIAGKPIKKRQRYFTVDVISGVIRENKAACENNVSYECYFFTRHEAEMYSKTVILYRQLQAFIKTTELTNKGR